MLKGLVIFGLIYFATFAPGYPAKGGDNQQPKGQESPSPSVTIVDNSSRQAQANPTEQKSPEPHAGIEWANWALVLIGAITFIAVWKQARESAKATEVMRESVQTQAAGLKQWVEVQIMGTEWDVAPRITLRFNAANQTAYPLTIREILVRVSGSRSSDLRWDESKRKDEVTLSPGIRQGVVVGPTDTSQYQFLTVVELDAPMAEAYKGHNLTLSISGQLSFKPVIGPVEKQVFGEMVVCGPNRVQVLPLWAELARDGNARRQNG